MNALMTVSFLNTYRLCHCVRQCSRSNPQISQITQKGKSISHKKAQKAQKIFPIVTFTRVASYQDQ